MPCRASVPRESGFLRILQRIAHGLAIVGFVADNSVVDPIAFDVLLHLATLIAVLIYFRTDLASLCRGLVRPADSLSTSLPGELSARSLLLALGTGTAGTALLFLVMGDIAELLLLE